MNAKPLITASATLLAASGCQLRPWTPSVSVAFSSEDVPDGRSVRVPTSYELLSRWMLPPTNPWSGYVKGTLIASVRAMVPPVEDTMQPLPDVRSLRIVQRAEAAARHLAGATLQPHVAWFVDLRGAASIQFASTLTQLRANSVSPVITFNHWPSVDGVIPADETLSALIQFVPLMPQSNAPPMFVLDAWRLAYRGDAMDEGNVTDNRYYLSPADLPSPEVMKARGMTHVVYLVESLDDTDQEEDDLNVLFSSYREAGIQISMIDLEFAGKPLTDVSLREQLESNGLYPVRRRTLLDDVLFFVRARGGFGGPIGRPGFSKSGRGRIVGRGGWSGFGG